MYCVMFEYENSCLFIEKSYSLNFCRKKPLQDSFKTSGKVEKFSLEIILEIARENIHSSQKYVNECFNPLENLL